MPLLAFRFCVKNLAVGEFVFAFFDNKVTDDFIGVEALPLGDPVILWFVELYLEGAAGDRP